MTVFPCKFVVSSGLPDRPATGTDFVQDHIARFGAPKRRAYQIPAKLHSHKGHEFRHELRRDVVNLELQRRQAAKKAERDRILDGPKPTLEQRLAAIPPPTHTPIAPKPVLLNFEKLTPEDLVRIFTPKFQAVLNRLDVFEAFHFSDEHELDHLRDLKSLIDRLERLKKTLRDQGYCTNKAEFQSWNYGLKEIGSISFKSLRKRQVDIVKNLSRVWRSNYFGLK